jgi:hypothetical protein
MQCSAMGRMRNIWISELFIQISVDKEHIKSIWNFNKAGHLQYNVHEKRPGRKGQELYSKWKQS